MLNQGTLNDQWCHNVVAMAKKAKCCAPDLDYYDGNFKVAHGYCTNEWLIIKIEFWICRKLDSIIS